MVGMWTLRFIYVTLVFLALGCGSEVPQDTPPQSFVNSFQTNSGSLATFTGNPTTQLDLFVDDAIVDYLSTVLLQQNQILNCQIQNPPSHASLERGFVLSFEEQEIYLTGVALTYSDLQRLSQTFDEISCRVTATYEDGRQEAFESPAASLKLLPGSFQSAESGKN